MAGRAGREAGRLIDPSIRCVHHDADQPPEGTTMMRTTRAGVRQVLATAAVMAFAAVPAAHAQLAVQHDSTTVSETAGNGNGIPEPGDTLALTENVVSAEPGVVLTGVTGTLATSFADASVTGANAPYPDLSFGLPTGNAAPFGVSLSSAMECGAAVPFTLTLHTSAGDTDSPFVLPTGAAGAFAAHESSDVPRAIPDSASMVSTLTIGGSGGRAKGVRVRIGHITHTYDGDLTLTLVSPDGRAVKLVGAKGGNGQDFVDTVFDDSAASPIRTTTPAPFTGTFRPAQPLSAMDGAPLAGDWQLKITDGSFGNIGSIDAWGVDIAPAVCAPQPPPPPPPADDDDDDQHDCGLHNGHGHGNDKPKKNDGHDKKHPRDCPDHKGRGHR
jgi:subtilisin-like proprotein convertase family protein